MFSVRSLSMLSLSGRGKTGFRWSSTLLVLEPLNGGKSLNPASLNALTGAHAANGKKPVHALLLAESASPECLGTLRKEHGALIEKVIVAAHPSLKTPLAEIAAPIIAKVAQSAKYSKIVAAHTAFGKNVLPRSAGSLAKICITDVTGIDEADTTIYTRPIYAGNAVARVQTKSDLTFLTLRPTAFPPATAGSSGEAAVEEHKFEPAQSATKWEGEQVAKSDRPQLSSAKIVVSGGRALKSAENFKILYDLADKIGGAVGASRAAVDAGFVANDLQIGQTGKIVAPQLYIAVGISGAIQHVAGMKDSKTIVAINKDADTPIFAIADYALQGDLFTIIPELTSKVSKK